VKTDARTAFGRRGRNAQYGTDRQDEGETALHHLVVQVSNDSTSIWILPVSEVIFSEVMLALSRLSQQACQPGLLMWHANPMVMCSAENMMVRTLQDL
jgi:hypothetical protein